MKNFMALTEAINYIDENIYEDLQRETIAENSFVSLSSLEKIFRYALHLSISDYITRRKMTVAAMEISKKRDNITEIAYKLGYASPEVFSRAFKRVWGIIPSEFNKKHKFTGLFPKINFNYIEGECLYMARKQVDISLAYDFLKENHGTYVLCFDIKGMMGINKISHKAGDLAILEMVKRLEKYATDEMCILRVGGDEFVVITCLKEEKEAKILMKKILSHNEEPILFEEQNIPISLWCGIVTIPGALRYGEFFTQVHSTIMESKK